MNRKQLGKIQKVYIGLGGYQECQYGISFTFGSEKDCWGVDTFENTEKVEQYLKEAKVTDVNNLKNIPVECEFDESRTLKSWRILTEVL
jgi:hypothetical protein